jgi:hypothetical protein
MLLVSVKDLATGNTQSTPIKALNLSSNELENKPRDDNPDYQNDYKLREQVENTQKAAILIRETEEQLRHLLEQGIADRSLIVGIVEYLQAAIDIQDNLRDQSLSNTSLPVLVEMGKPIFYTKPEFSLLKAQENAEVAEVIDAVFDATDVPLDWTDIDYEVID